jgi:hypothetical protein
MPAAGDFAFHHEISVRQREGNRPLVKADPCIGAPCVAHSFEATGVVGYLQSSSKTITLGHWNASSV